jgi:hypothetical protein
MDVYCLVLIKSLVVELVSSLPLLPNPAIQRDPKTEPTATHSQPISPTIHLIPNLWSNGFAIKILYRITRHWCLLSARWIQFTLSYTLPLRYILILSSILRLWIQNDHFLWWWWRRRGFRLKFLCISHFYTQPFFQYFITKETGGPPSNLPNVILLIFYLPHTCYKSRDSSVVVALGYGLDDRGSRVRFPAGAGNFSPHHRVQNSSGAYPASYLMGTRVSFPGGKAAEAWSWPFTSI